MVNLASYALELFNITLSDEQSQQFERYLELLTEWNAQMNLTAIIEPDAVRIRHFLDSLSVVRVVSFKQGMRVIDIGTGAGFPGVALQIAFPFLNTMLLDSTGKKINFLNHVIQTLELKNVSAIQARAEDAAHLTQYRAGYDVVLARAVARLPILAEYLIPFAKVKGVCVAMKGITAETEIGDSRNALQKLGASLNANVEVRLPDVDDPHYLVVIRKDKKTPDIYPRKAGIPVKKPL